MNPNIALWLACAALLAIVITIVSFFIRDMLKEGKEDA